MSNSEYIESGILEAYALGMLPPQKAQEVKAKTDSDPEVRNALREVEKTLEDLARAHSVTPRPEWKGEIMKKALGESPAGKTQNSGISQSVVSGRRNYQWLAVAASILLLFSLVLNFIQFRSQRDLESELMTSQRKLAELTAQNNAMVASNRELHNDLTVLRDPQTTIFAMKSVEGREPGYRADVFWHTPSERVFMDVKNLPRPPEGMQYQLWALKDDQTMDMGLIDLEKDAAEMREMGEVETADSFAITLEPKGGSKQPSLQQMYVHGGPVNI